MGKKMLLSKHDPYRKMPNHQYVTQWIITKMNTTMNNYEGQSKKNNNNNKTPAVPLCFLPITSPIPFQILPLFWPVMVWLGFSLLYSTCYFFSQLCACEIHLCHYLWAIATCSHCFHSTGRLPHKEAGYSAKDGYFDCF